MPKLPRLIAAEAERKLLRAGLGQLADGLPLRPALSHREAGMLGENAGIGGGGSGKMGAVSLFL